MNPVTLIVIASFAAGLVTPPLAIALAFFVYELRTSIARTLTKHRSPDGAVVKQLNFRRASSFWSM